jgi:hypothetical protein
VYFPDSATVSTCAVAGDVLFATDTARIARGPAGVTDELVVNAVPGAAAVKVMTDPEAKAVGVWAALPLDV